MLGSCDLAIPNVEAAMFDTLIVSKPRARRAWRRELTGPTLSLVAHSLVLYAAAVATATAGAGGAVAVRDTRMIYVRHLDRPATEPRAPALPGVFRTLLAPVTIPTTIPPIDLTETWDPTSYSGVGVPLGPNRSVEGQVDPSQVFVEAVVDEPPVSVSFPPAEYPRMLLEARIEGSVVLEAVIDTLGHPEPGSIRVLSSTNRGFEAAARAAFGKALYRPGRVRGQKVRVLVRQPLRFALPR
jgi:TonB family protein